MDNRESRVPFGLLFEEPVSLPKDLIIPTYDEQTDLSYVYDSDGSRIPCVEFNLAGTDTVTKVRQETTDTDLFDDHRGHTRIRRSLLGTDTITEAANEPTDQD